MARFALNIERYGLPEDYYATYLERLNAVTIQDVQEMAAKYLKPENAVIVVAGNRDEVAESLIPFSASGEVEFFDAFGRPIEDAGLLPAPEGYTAETVINNYIEAIGGRANLKAVEDIKTEMTASTMGMELQVESYQKKPHYYMSKMQMGGMTLQQQLFDGDKALIVSQMGTQEFTEGEMFEMFKLQSVMNIELYYDDYGFETELLGIETINGVPAYKVKMISPAGAQSFDYFSTETGLKIKSLTDESSTTYSDYQEVGGILMPHKTIQEAGPQRVEMRVDNVEINSGLESSFFVIE